MITGKRRFRLTASVPKEDDLHLAVVRALAVLLPHGAVLNTWELRNAASAIEGARRKRLSALPGWPDIGVFFRGKVVLIELKRAKYGWLSTAQRELHQRLNDTGFEVAVCRSVDDVLSAVAEGGIPLRAHVMM